MASREEWGLFQFNSLKQFSVSDDFEILESFSEENLLPSTIDSLELTNCSNLRIINYKGLLHLTSLESLYIEDCPCLESLPEEGLPSSLSTLSIHGCPLLKKLYQKEEGERWHTISHIPSVSISWMTAKMRCNFFLNDHIHQSVYTCQTLLNSLSNSKIMHGIVCFMLNSAMLNSA